MEDKIFVRFIHPKFENLRKDIEWKGNVGVLLFNHEENEYYIHSDIHTPLKLSNLEEGKHFFYSKYEPKNKCNL